MASVERSISVLVSGEVFFIQVPAKTPQANLRGRLDSRDAAGYLLTCTCMKLSRAEMLRTLIVVPVLGTGTLAQPR